MINNDLGPKQLLPIELQLHIYIRVSRLTQNCDLIMDSTFPLVPIANFLACLLVVASVSRNMFQSWNIGVCSFAIWVVGESLIIGVNSIVWVDNVENVAPVWCDISKLMSLPSP